MRFTFFSFLLVASTLVSAQVEVSGKVLDASTNEPVPYANIFLKNTDLGTTAYRDGSFVLHVDSVLRDSLSISCMGFRNTNVYLPDAVAEKHLIIKLTEARHELHEVKVKPREMDVLTTGIDPWKVPVLSLKSCQGAFGKHAIARHITNDHQVNGFIKSLSVFICDEGNYKAPFRLNLLQVDPLTSAPSEPLVSQDFILQATEGGEWVTLDLKKRLIRFPPNGIFVLLQSLPLDSVEIAQYRLRSPEMSDFEILNSAPAFGFQSEKCHQVVNRYWHSYADSAWKLYNYPEVDLNSHCQSPRIKAEISYYADQKLKTKKLKPKRKLRKVVDVPRQDLIKYPQSSPIELVHSLQKTSTADDLAYLFNHLIYYESKEELESIVGGLEELQSIKGTEEWDHRKQRSLQLLKEMEANLSSLRKSDQGFKFDLFITDHIWHLYYENGLWKMGLATSLIGQSETDAVKMEEAAQ